MDAVSLNVKDLKKHRFLGFLVLGPGTLLSAVLISAVAAWLLHIPVVLAAMLGAALASTDPVLLRSIIRNPQLSPPVRQALRIESGLNDAVLLPIVLVGIAVATQQAHFSGASWSKLALQMVILSPAAGIIVALSAIGALDLVRRRLGVRRDYESIYSLGIAFAAFAAAESVHGSGFIAAFAAGITIAMLDVELCDCFIEYGETTAEMALLFSFVLFGISLIWQGIATATPLAFLFAALVILIRPFAFIPSLAFAKLSWRDRAQLGWFGPRGLSSLLLILLPVFASVSGSAFLLSICCLVVLCSVVLHGFSPMFLLRPAKALTTQEPQAADLRTNQPASTSPPAASASTSKSLPILNVLPETEFITPEQVRTLMDTAPDSLVLVDARSRRSFDESPNLLDGALRIDPDQAVNDARRQKLPQEPVIAVLCA